MHTLSAACFFSHADIIFKRGQAHAHEDNGTSCRLVCFVHIYLTFGTDFLQSATNEREGGQRAAKEKISNELKKQTKQVK